MSCSSNCSIVIVDFCRDMNWPLTAWQHCGYWNKLIIINHDQFYKYFKGRDEHLWMAAGLSELEQGQQQGAEVLPVQGGQLGARLQLPQLGHHLPGDVDVLPPAEVVGVKYFLCKLKYFYL